MSAQPKPVSTPLDIRPLERHEFDLIWPIFSAVIGAGKTYSYSPDLTKEQGEAIWFAPEKTPFVAMVEGEVVGTFYLRANQLGLGDHVANGGFMVSPDHAGRGYGTQMGARMVEEARKAGYHGMQFNFVVENNEPSIRVWKKLGFEIVGHVPDAFRHSELGLMGVYIMYRKL